jgi:hypothetical protein
MAMRGKDVSGIEGIGEAVTGGMAARAAEPESGRREESGAGNCLNCGAALAGGYCHRCGQGAHVHRSIHGFWHEFLHGVLHFEGKMWRTLPMLAWRPGELTRRYIAGERARFVSPLALFLFSVFTMFAVFSLAGQNLIGAPDVGAARAEIAAELETSRRTLRGLEAERARTPGGPREAALDERIRAARADVFRLDQAGRIVADGQEMASDLNVETGWARLDEGIRKANENRSLLFYKLQSNAYKFSWALIPVSLPFLWLLFLHRSRYRRAYGAYDHLVFVTYSIAFMSLTSIVFVLLTLVGLGGAWLNLAFLVIAPAHFYRQLRGAYQLPWPSAAWRTIALIAFAMLALALFGLMLLAIGVLG